MDELYLTKHLLELLGYRHWSVKPIHSGGGLCIHAHNEIWLDVEHLQSAPWILHEIAHIRYPDHSAQWGDWYTELMDGYMEYKTGRPYILTPDRMGLSA